MFEKLKALFRRDPPPAAYVPAPDTEPRPNRLYAPPDPKGLPGSRVYHEYFVTETADESGQWPWSCRVYAPGGRILKNDGKAKTRERACQAAIAWANEMKTTVRKEMA